jgi:prepilin-type N-terminal cleavage/methylation domain-containing protein
MHNLNGLHGIEGWPVACTCVVAMPRHGAQMAESMKKTAKSKRQAGFSLLEMMIVVAVSIIITAIAVPSFLNTTAFLRAAGDLRSVNALTAQAKMRAAAEFTHARVFADLNANTYQLQVWNKASSCWVSEANSASTCVTYSGSHPTGTVINLSQGDTFGFGSISPGPTPGQSTIQQAAACRNDANSSNIGNTACIVFNSRGIPIDSSNAPIATGALYLTNGTVVNGVTVSATGSIQPWSTPASSANWAGQ